MKENTPTPLFTTVNFRAARSTQSFFNNFLFLLSPVEIKHCIQSEREMFMRSSRSVEKKNPDPPPQPPSRVYVHKVFSRCSKKKVRERAAIDVRGEAGVSEEADVSGCVMEIVQMSPLLSATRQNLEYRHFELENLYDNRESTQSAFFQDDFFFIPSTHSTCPIICCSASLSTSSFRGLFFFARSLVYELTLWKTSSLIIRKIIQTNENFFFSRLFAPCQPHQPLPPPFSSLPLLHFRFSLY